MGILRLCYFILRFECIWVNLVMDIILIGFEIGVYVFEDFNWLG